MTTVAAFKKGDKSVTIVRTVKPGTKRVFFYPMTGDGKRITATRFARQYDAVSLGKAYLNA